MYYVVILRVSSSEVSCMSIYMGGSPYIYSCSLTLSEVRQDFFLITQLLQLFNMFNFLYSKHHLI